MRAAFQVKDAIYNAPPPLKAAAARHLLTYHEVGPENGVRGTKDSPARHGERHPSLVPPSVIKG
jgi:hypothetical protein